MFNDYFENVWNVTLLEYYVYLICWVDASGLMS